MKLIHLIVFFITSIHSYSVLADMSDEYFNSLRNMNDVMDFIRIQATWAGDRVVLNEEGKDIVMSHAKNTFLFEDCLKTITDSRSSRQRVVFDVESALVLEKIAPLFTKKHNFVILLLRINLGPNGLPTKFGDVSHLDTMLNKLRLNEAVKFGLGFTSMSYGPEKFYTAIHFKALAVAMTFKSIATRTILVNFDITLITNTDMDTILNEVLDFKYIMLQSENMQAEAGVKLDQIDMFEKLGAGEKMFFDVSDKLRARILKNIAGRFKYSPAMILLAVAVSYWRL